jgi:hypothetical protein
MAHRERSLILVVRMKNHLPITALNGQIGESFGSTQRLHNFVNLGQWETGFPYDVVKFPVFPQMRRYPLTLQKRTTADEQELSGSSVTPRRCTFSSISLISACRARGSLFGVGCSIVSPTCLYVGILCWSARS